jgi:uncharacterized membrane protein YhaH (DUF805 family)
MSQPALGEAGLAWLRYFFSKSGRVGRSGFWRFLAIFAGLLFATAVAFGAFDFAFYGRLVIPKNMDPRLGALCLAVAPFYITVLFGAFTVPIKRLHDRNQSGWWLVFYILTPIILFTMAEDNARSSGDDTGVLILELIGLGIWIAAIIQLGVLRGTRGSNYYGADPGIRAD